jgi:hypothetical protein
MKAAGFFEIPAANLTQKKTAKDITAVIPILCS